LHSLISNHTTDALFHKILFTLWYIWKARNDHHFRGQTWTTQQVHNAVAAHISSNTQARLLQATRSAIAPTVDAHHHPPPHHQAPNSTQGTPHSPAGPTMTNQRLHQPSNLGGVSTNQDTTLQHTDIQSPLLLQEAAHSMVDPHLLFLHFLRESDAILMHQYP
jgi:hypothetical protein